MFFFSFVFKFRLETGVLKEKVEKEVGRAKQANMAIFVAHPQVSLTIPQGFDSICLFVNEHSLLQ